MKNGYRIPTLLCLALIACPLLRAQGIPAAIRTLNFSVFGGATGDYTGFDGGKNLGITAGADLGFRPYHLFYFSIEGRGTYPVDDGKVDSQKSFLFGGRVQRYYNRFRPYADFLYGRAQIDYLDGGYPNPEGTLLFISSVSNVFAFGGGLDYVLTPHFDLKIDAQFEHLTTPVTTSGAMYSKPITVGLVYHFGDPALP
ncbi:MAG: outer membrane protein [Acidobacteriota bacterium]